MPPTEQPRQPSGILGSKLLRARKDVGMSTRSVAETLAKFGRVVSHATIANYERGVSVPEGSLLGLLADVYRRPLTWFVDGSPGLTGIRYRNLRSRVKASERHQFEGSSLRVLEAYRAVERLLKRPLLAQRAVRFSARTSATKAAADLRQEFGVPANQPIPSVIQLLETLGIRVVELTTEHAIDGFAARLGEEHVVVLNPQTANCRARLDAAHEMFHVLFGDCDGDSDGDFDSETETRAFQAASCLLMPDSVLAEAFAGRSMVRLVQYRERFGISLAAMVYRAQRSRILSESEARWLWIEFAKRGWRAQEPGHVRADRAFRFESLLEEAHVQCGMAWTEIATSTGMRENEIQARLSRMLGAEEYAPRKEVVRTETTLRLAR